MANLVKILYLGDIVGRPGRDAVIKNIRAIKHIHNIDFIIANAENATSGSGITKEHCELLHNAGVDLMTLGDHVWDRRGFDTVIDKLPYICRPANLPQECPGHTFITSEKDGTKIGTCIILGQHFMKITPSEPPLFAAQRILSQHGQEVDIFLMEIHAEATSEKNALGWYFDGQVSGIVGSHTHVQTADERILPHGTAYITDLGMCGPHKSVIGRDISAVINTMKFAMPQHLEVATDDVRLNGALLTVDKSTGHATKIARFTESFDM